MAQVEKLVGIESPLEVGQKINEIIEKGVGGAFNLFDTMLKDHILTYEETYGWALQGTYVYKEAVAGSRYGYPDFYNKCTSEKELGTPTETTLGDSTVTLYVNANGHTFYDIADKEAIDTWYNTYGIAWYYGVDTDAERIFLPRTKWFIQPTGEITEVNSVNEAGLPTHTHTRGTMNITGRVGAWQMAGNICNGSFSLYDNGSVSYGGYASTERSFGANFDASRTWSGETSEPTNDIYGNSDTVQPPSINQLLYICVGNTNVESAVTDVVDVTTTENDTMPLFTGQYFDFKPNNVSWLKAGEQANSGGIYAFTYNELVNILNGETKYGDLKVINVADMEVGVDYSEYWKVNQTDMTFITPIRTDERVLIEKKEPTSDDPTWYNLYSDGWLEQGGLCSTSGAVQGEYWVVNLLKDYINTEYDIQITFGGNTSTDRGSAQNLFAWSDAKTTSQFNWGAVGGEGLAYKFSGYWQTYGYATIPTNVNLYYKVANAVQNLELLDAGEVLEAVNNVVPNNSSLIAGYGMPDYSASIAITTGYTAPTDGWIGLYASTNGVYALVNGINITGDLLTSYDRGGGGIFPVSANDVITFSKNQPSAAYFYPAKGAK